MASWTALHRSGMAHRIYLVNRYVREFEMTPDPNLEAFVLILADQIRRQRKSGGLRDVIESKEMKTKLNDSVAHFSTANHLNNAPELALAIWNEPHRAKYALDLFTGKIKPKEV